MPDPLCPECLTCDRKTPLTWIIGRRRRTGYWWCWVCNRAFSRWAMDARAREGTIEYAEEAAD